MRAAALVLPLVLAFPGAARASGPTSTGTATATHSATGFGTPTETPSASATLTATLVSVPCLLANHSFETPSPSNWTYLNTSGGAGSYVSGGGANVLNGSASVSITDANDQGINFWTQTVSAGFVVGGVYEFSVWLKTASVAPASNGLGARLLVTFYNSASAVIGTAFSAPSTGSVAWTVATTPATLIPAGTASFEFSLQLHRSTGTVWFDDACAFPAVLPTATASATATFSSTATVTATPSASPTATSTETVTATASETVVPGSTATATATASETVNPLFTSTPSETVPPSPTETVTATHSHSPTETPSDSPTPPPTATVTATVTDTPQPPPSFNGGINAKLVSPSGGVAPGTTLNYVIQFENTGGDAVGVTIADVLDPALDWNASFTSGGAALVATPNAGGLAVWSIGSLPSGSQGGIFFSVPLRGNVCPNLVVPNVATVRVQLTPVASLASTPNVVTIPTLLDAEVEPLLPINVAALATAVPVLDLTIRSAPVAGARTAEIQQILVTIEDDAGNLLVPPAVLVSALRISDESGQVVGQASGGFLQPNPAVIVLSVPPSVAPGGSRVLRLSADFAAALPPGLAFRFVLRQGAIGVTDSSSGCALPVLARGGSFPLVTHLSGAAPRDFEKSFAALPNPISQAAGTMFRFFLASAGSVDLSIWTRTGDPVARLVTGSRRSAGLHLDVRWNGRNGSGEAVRPGIYVARLRFTPDGGAAQTARLAVGVVP